MNSSFPYLKALRMAKKPYSKEKKTRSIWDEDVDFEKVMKEKDGKKLHEEFPNDFAPDGQPYGDF